METQSDQSSNQSSDRGGSSGSSGDSGRGEVSLQVEGGGRGGPSKSEGPNRSEAPNLPNKSEQIESREPKPGQSEQPKEGPSKSEGPNQSTEPKPGQSEKPKPEANRTESGKTVLMTHPINDGKSHPGRGATGEGGHGLDKHPDPKDWYNKAAQDLKADAGTRVQAPMGGKVTVDRDPNANHEGHKFGDTVTISNGDFKVVLMHMDAKSGLETGMTVKAGEQIGQVTHWDSNPSETHLHVATATRGSDGGFHGVDPGPMLGATQGGSGREVTNVGDGSYVVGDQKHTMPTAPPPERSSQSGRENDQSCTRR